MKDNTKLLHCKKDI